MAELEEKEFIDYFHVRPEHQGTGVGKALLGVIEDEAAAEASGKLRAG